MPYDSDWLGPQSKASKVKSLQVPFSLLVQQHKIPVDENDLKTIKTADLFKSNVLTVQKYCKLIYFVRDCP